MSVPFYTDTSVHGHVVLMCDRPVIARSGLNLTMNQCRKCRQCLKRTRREWERRAQMESLHHDRTWFVTLTFRYVPPIDERYAEIQKWLKRVRKNSPEFRYLTTEEYGTHNGRFHVHLLVHGSSDLKQRHLRSKWKGGISQAKIARPGHTRYVCKYIAKAVGQGKSRSVRSSIRYGNGDAYAGYIHDAVAVVKDVFGGARLRSVGGVPSSYRLASAAAS